MKAITKAGNRVRRFLREHADINGRTSDNYPLDKDGIKIINAHTGRYCIGSIMIIEKESGVFTIIANEGCKRMELDIFNYINNRK